MKKIRINELARDLEIKANLILDKLPDFGVTEKKTHSSSVDEDVAEKLRDFFAPGAKITGSDRYTNGASRHRENGHTRVVEAPEEEEIAESGVNAASAEAPASTEVSAAKTEAQTPATETAEEAKPAPRLHLRPPLASPVRPPIGGRPAAGQAPATPSPAPAQAPAGAEPATVAEPVAVAQPAAVPTPVVSAPAPAAAQQTAAPQQAPTIQQTGSPQPGPGRPTPPPARPIPTAPSGGPRPGQALTGPRAPLPASASPGTPRPMPGPGAPRPQQQNYQGPRPQAGQPLRPQGARPGVTPGSPIHPRPQGPGAPQPQRQGQPGAPGARTIVQPAARPVVPPRQDLQQRILQQQRSAAAPGQPAMRQMPGAPRPASPAPGRPIGPQRPGSGPQMRGPGQPQGRAPYPGSRPPGRGMHPTTRGIPGPGALVPPPGPEQRRPPNRGARPQVRSRDREIEEKNLRPTVRRDRDTGPPPINREITISEGITVKELSEKLDVKANLVIRKLLDRGIFATINQTLDSQLATDLSRDFGASTSTLTFEEEANWDIELAEDTKDLIRRPPVVTIMGHVDHGKTSLLDAIRQANVAAREAGGITQHIGAYYIEKNNQKIVFIDTPGHEAFTRMRARGAKVTDVVVLVVAADDGVMPQTIEAIDHARAAKVPIVVAINKVDKPDAQPDRIKQQLSDRGLLAEDWGGDVVMVPVSARTRAGLDQLLEMILLVSEIADLKANPTRPAMGSVIESKLDRGRGPVATVLVRNGTLRVGDFFICGEVFGKVRAMINDRGEQVREAGPSLPVEVLGLDALPDAGDEFQVVTDTAKAKQIVLYREEKSREEARNKNKRLTLEQFQKKMAAGDVKELPVILKADVNGSAEVLSETLQRLSTEKVKVNVIHSGVGAINENDVLLASASGGIIIGFNVRPDRKAEATAEHEKVDIRLHSIIYNLTDEMKKAMTGLLEPVFKEIHRGRAEVRETFRVSKVGTVAGCIVLEGTITRDCQLRLLRENAVVTTTKVGSLKRFKDDVSEVRMGMECGIVLDNYGDLRQGDVIDAFILEKIAPDLGA